MIVIGTHGRTGLNYLLVGSVAAHMFHAWLGRMSLGLSPAALMGAYWSGWYNSLSRPANRWSSGSRRHARLCGSPCSRRTACRPMTSAFTGAAHVETNRRATSKAVVWSM